MSDYKELKRLAEGLLETEWYTRLDLPPCSLAESEFIAAANPATVLALIAENESLRGLALELRRGVMCHSVHHCRSEQHELGEPCKVLARFDSALCLETRP